MNHTIHTGDINDKLNELKSSIHTVVIFDYDDTLYPTTLIRQLLQKRDNKSEEYKEYKSSKSTDTLILR